MRGLQRVAAKCKAVLPGMTTHASTHPCRAVRTGPCAHTAEFVIAEHTSAAARDACTTGSGAHASARCSALQPSPSTALTCAPARSSRRARSSAWRAAAIVGDLARLLAAVCRHPHRSGTPSSSHAFASAPAASSSCTITASPPCTATASAASPCACTSAPRASSMRAVSTCPPAIACHRGVCNCSCGGASASAGVSRSAGTRCRLNMRASEAVSPARAASRATVDVWTAAAAARGLQLPLSRQDRSGASKAMPMRRSRYRSSLKVTSGIRAACNSSAGRRGDGRDRDDRAGDAAESSRASCGMTSGGSSVRSVASAMVLSEGRVFSRP